MFCDYFAIVYLWLEFPTHSLQQFELPIELSSSKFIRLLINVHVMCIVALALLPSSLYMVTRGQSLPAGWAGLRTEPGES